MRLLLLTLFTSLFTLTLQAAPAKAVWSTYQGNALHTGVVDVTVNPDQFKVLWTKKIFPDYHPTSAGNITRAAAVTDKMIYVSSINPDTNKSTLVAIQIATGEFAWQVDMGNTQSITPPAYANNKIFVVTGEPALRAYDADSGKLIFQTPVSATSTINTPVADYQHVFVQAKQFHNINASTGQPDKVFYAAENAAPLVYNNQLYTFTENKELLVMDVNTGETLYSMPAEEMVGLTNQDMPPLLDAENNVLYFNPDILHQELYAYDLSKRNIRWVSGFRCDGSPVLHDNIIYITTYDSQYIALVALNAETGNSKWKWQPEYPDELKFDSTPVATHNILFVPGRENTYAVSLATHRPVWSLPKTGTLALGENVLFIVESDSTVTAVALN